MLKETLLKHISINEEKNEISITSELDRDDYLELKHYFELIEGEYKSKGKKFVFRTNPKPFIEAYLKTEIMPKKNPTAFFPTPSVIVKEMFRLSDFDCLPVDEEYQSKYKVLEPSAGVAGIADLIKEVAPFVQLDVIEILDVNQEVLRQKGYEPICMDFMNYNTDYSIRYDYVIMNPPYQGKTFIKHIKHAFNMLNERGILTAVIPTSFLNQNDKESLWLYEKVVQLGEVYHNPKGSFKEQGTNVDTCIIYINKELESWRTKEYQGCVNYWTWQVWLSLYSSGDVYTYLEKLKHDKNTKTKIKELILRELNEYKKDYIYFSYEYIDLYVEKLYQHYCYIVEDLNNEEIVAVEHKEEISSLPFVYDDVVLNTFATGKLF